MVPAAALGSRARCQGNGHARRDGRQMALPSFLGKAGRHGNGGGVAKHENEKGKTKQNKTNKRNKNKKNKKK